MIMNKGMKQSVMIPLGLVISAFLLRLYAALVPGIIVPDGVIYIDTAKMILAGQWARIDEFGVYSMYPFLIAVFHRVFGDWETAGRMISVVFGSLAVVPFYLLLKRIFDMRIALVAAIFFVVSPRLVEYSSNVVREPAFWCFSLCALWAAWEGMVLKKWFLVTVASLFVGLSAMTRMEGAALVPIIILWMAWYYLRLERSGIKTFLLFLLVFVVSFPILFLTPLYFLKNRIGKWEIGHVGSKIPYILSAGSENAAEAFRKSTDDADVVTRVLSKNKFAYFLWESIYKPFRSYHVLLIFLFLIGIVRRKVIPRDELREVPIFIWCYIFLLVSLLYVSRTYYLSTRHGMLISIPALVWVSIGFFELSDIIERIVRKFKPKWENPRNVMVWCLALICIIILPKTLSWSGYEKVEMKKAGKYLKMNGYITGRIAVEQRFSRLAFYADADFVVIPVGMAHKELYNFLRSNNVSLLVIDEVTVDGTINGFTKNVATMALERLEIRELKACKDYSIAVFKLKNDSAT